MTIRISWPTQTGKALTSIELYRAVGFDAKLDPLNPGTPYKVLDPTATGYVEDLKDLTEKTIYCYWVAAVKGTERLFGGRIVQGYFLDTGPGPTEIMRGDWACGYFGPVSTTDFFSLNDVRSQLTAAQLSSYNREPVGWHKFINRGRIIFIPEHPQFFGVLTALYNAGMMYGTDDNGIGTLPTPAGVKQNTRVKKDGREYKIRMPWAGVPGTNQLSLTESEWTHTMARLYLAGQDNWADTTDSLGMSLPIWNDLPLINNTSSYNDEGATYLIPLSGAYGYYFYAYRPFTWTTMNNVLSYNVYARLIFELVLP